MPLPGTPHAARVSLVWNYGGQVAENTFYVQDTTDAIFADPAGFAAQVNLAVVSALIPDHRAEVIYQGCQFEDIRTVPFGGGFYPRTPPIAGAIAGVTALPFNVSFSIKRLTANLGRSGRGRWYWAGMDEADLSGPNTVDSTRASNMVGALLAFQGDVEGGTYPVEMGIVSYYHDKVLRGAGLFQRIESWGLFDLIVDSMRKRLPGRGR